MRKYEIVQEVSKETGYVQRSISDILETFYEVVRKHALNGENVNINGFLNIKTEVVPPVHRYHIHKKQVIEFPERKKIVAQISPKWQISQPVN